MAAFPVPGPFEIYESAAARIKCTERAEHGLRFGHGWRGGRQAERGRAGQDARTDAWH